MQLLRNYKCHSKVMQQVQVSEERRQGHPCPQPGLEQVVFVESSEPHMLEAALFR